jgi:hypothetical protein
MADVHRPWPSAIGHRPLADKSKILSAIMILEA